jgi:hypothetical protein
MPEITSNTQNVTHIFYLVLLMSLLPHSLATKHTMSTDVLSVWMSDVLKSEVFVMDIHSVHSFHICSEYLYAHTR